MTSHHSIKEIREDIANTRSHIASTLDEIDNRRQELKDWRTSIRTYPLASVAIAGLVGVLLSGNVLRTLKPPQPILNQLLWGGVSAILLRRTSEKKYPGLNFS
jgi:hypothetical protein